MTMDMIDARIKTYPLWQTYKDKLQATPNQWLPRKIVSDKPLSPRVRDKLRPKPEELIGRWIVVDPGQPIPKPAVVLALKQAQPGVGRKLWLAAYMTTGVA